MTLNCANNAVSQRNESFHSISVDSFDFSQANQLLAEKSALQRVEWSLEQFPGQHVLTSSFGAQSAVSLHMLTQVFPNIPVVLVDTGYLFKETYQFIDELTEQLKLNLKIYRSSHSSAWQEARYGQLWEQGLDGIETYNKMNKVEPLQRALDELDCMTWYAGLRRQQSQSRQDIDFVRAQGERFKLHPIADWSNRDLHLYLQQHQLPYHPLWEQGYVSIGDVHTTRPISDAQSEEDTRFFGLKRECGIHEI